jgi:hypothetical protein
MQKIYNISQDYSLLVFFFQNFQVVQLVVIIYKYI